VSFEVDHDDHTVVMTSDHELGCQIIEVRCPHAPREEGDPVWLARDSSTSRVIAFGYVEQPVRDEARKHKKLSGNRVHVGRLKLGMILKR